MGQGFRVYVNGLNFKTLTVFGVRNHDQMKSVPKPVGKSPENIAEGPRL